MADREQAEELVTDAISKARADGVDVLTMGKALIRAGVLLLQCEMCIRLPVQWTQIDACRWALEEDKDR